MSESTKDIDQQETQEWVDSIASVIKNQGLERAQFLFKSLINKATEAGDPLPPDTLITPYRNTLPVSAEEKMPGDMFMERSIRGIVRWNAMAMVMRANQLDLELGGHISSFASSATLYDVGFNYFFRGETENQMADLVFFQGHSSPGIYSRSYLEGRLTEDQLNHFRQEVDGNGLSSYPHPHLMPDYWQFPTVSMGLGPIQAIYQAHVMSRNLWARSVWQAVKNSAISTL